TRPVRYRRPPAITTDGAAPVTSTPPPSAPPPSTPPPSTPPAAARKPAPPLPPLPTGPVTSVAEAIDRMEAIAAALPPTDGLSCFNRMYLTVTRAVGERIGAGFFVDEEFMTRLDVVFANIYLAAVDAWARDESQVSRSWRVLLSRRTDTDVAPLQFALAGLNTHINHDLCIAVVTTSRELGTSPDEGSHEEDFERVNAVLGELNESIRESFETGIILELDRRVDGLDNLVANFSITAARDVAWDNARALWHLDDNRFLSGPFLDSLDRFVAFAGRGLLIPLGLASRGSV
ncbi:MAG: DUF5995 family protein, partial [Acidimicrobiales bacterium]